MSDEYGGDFVTLTDDDGNEEEFEHLDTLEYKGEIYMAFVPAGAEDDENVEVVILKAAKDEKGEDELVTIEDEDLLDEVFDEFMKRIDNDEGDDDDEDDGEDSEKE